MEEEWSPDELSEGFDSVDYDSESDDDTEALIESIVSKSGQPLKKRKMEITMKNKTNEKTPPIKQTPLIEKGKTKTPTTLINNGKTKTPTTHPI